MIPTQTVSEDVKTFFIWATEIKICR